MAVASSDQPSFDPRREVLALEARLGALKEAPKINIPEIAKGLAEFIVEIGSAELKDMPAQLENVKKIADPKDAIAALNREIQKVKAFLQNTKNPIAQYQRKISIFEDQMNHCQDISKKIEAIKQKFNEADQKNFDIIQGQLDGIHVKVMNGTVVQGDFEVTMRIMTEVHAHVFAGPAAPRQTPARMSLEEQIVEQIEIQISNFDNNKKLAEFEGQYFFTVRALRLVLAKVVNGDYGQELKDALDNRDVCILSPTALFSLIIIDYSTRAVPEILQGQNDRLSQIWPLLNQMDSLTNLILRKDNLSDQEKPLAKLIDEIIVQSGI